MTPHQRRALDWISLFIQRNRYSPTLWEIAYGLGLRSTSTVHRHLRRLERDGHIRRRRNGGRSIDVLALPRPAQPAVPAGCCGHRWRFRDPDTGEPREAECWRVVSEEGVECGQHGSAA